MIQKTERHDWLFRLSRATRSRLFDASARVSLGWLRPRRAGFCFLSHSQHATVTRLSHVRLIVIRNYGMTNDSGNV